MSSGIRRRLVAGVAVTAALTGGTLIGAGPASAESPTPFVLFGSADSASQDGNGLGGFADDVLFQFGFCAPIGLPFMIFGADRPDFYRDLCESSGPSGNDEVG